MFVLSKKDNVVLSDMPYVSLLQFYLSRKTNLFGKLWSVIVMQARCSLGEGWHCSSGILLNRGFIAVA